jgi:hypothetical protein
MSYAYDGYCAITFSAWTKREHSDKIMKPCVYKDWNIV